jgi:pimeloyl-ACP methyl ester carboxylesterase
MLDLKHDYIFATVDPPMKSIFKILLPALLFVTACGESDGPLPEQLDSRGRILEIRPYGSYSIAEVEAMMLEFNPALPQLIEAKYGADLYVILYETPDWNGRMTYASGMLAVPQSPDGSKHGFISYQHGTVLDKVGVPTRGQGEWQLGAILASNGFLCSMPDYLGLGYGPGPHPYIHAATEASASIDMLRASRNALRKLKKGWNTQLYLIGYSQGGHATMAMHRELQQRHKSEFPVTASVPMAGPYDVSGVQEGVIVSRSPYPTPGYLPYIVYSYEMVYDFFPGDIKDIFKAPYDSIVDASIKSQTVGMGTLNNLVTPVPRDMVKDEFMAEYEGNGGHPFRAALRDNDLWNWVPETPLVMMFCQGDDQVSYVNAEYCYNKMIEQGADPRLVRLFPVDPALNHADCAVPTFMLAKFLIDSLVAVSPVE